jgi:hypothetical protein
MIKRRHIAYVILAALVAAVLIPFCAHAQLGPKLRRFIRLHIGARTVLSASPDSHWKLDELSIADRLDSISTNTLSSGSGDGPGLINGACKLLYLAGGTPAYQLLGDNDFSWCGWVKFNTIVDGDTVMMHSSPVNTMDCALYVQATNFIWGVRTNSAPGYAVDTVVTNTYVITDSTWIFLAFWHDTVNDLIGLSVNNSAATTKAVAGPMTDKTVNGLRFGQGALNHAQYMDGYIDSWSFFRHKLSAAEINYLYNGGSGRDWPF